MSNKRIKLSFEEEDDGADTSFHATKATKKVSAKSKRPIMQAPVVIELEQPAEVVSVAATASSSSSYSKESLAALRQAQNFATSVTKDLDILNAAGVSEQEEMEVELSGDQAEALEAAMELQEEQQQKYHESSAYDADQAALLSAKQHTQRLLKKRKHDDRLFINPTTNNSNKTHLADLDPSLDNDLTWEDEIIQRGSIHRINKNTIKPRIPNNNPDTDSPEVDLDTQDLTQIAQTALAQSQGKIEDFNRRLSALTQEMAVSKNRVLECDEKLDIALERLKTTELAKKFWPDFVGMLREKSPYIVELQTALLTHYKLNFSNHTKSRLVHMEKQILQVKESGLLIGIGDYHMLQPEDEFLETQKEVNLSNLHTASVSLMDDVAVELLTPQYVTEQVLSLKSVLLLRYDEAHVPLSLCTLFWPLLLLDLITIDTASSNNKRGKEGKEGEEVLLLSKSAWLTAAMTVDNCENVITKYLLQHAIDDFYLPLLAHKLDLHSSTSSPIVAVLKDLTALSKQCNTDKEHQQVLQKLHNALFTALQQQTEVEICFAICKNETVGLAYMLHTVHTISLILMQVKLLVQFLLFEELLYWLKSGLMVKLLPVMAKLSTCDASSTSDVQSMLLKLVQSVVDVLNTYQAKYNDEQEFEYELAQAGLTDWKKLSELLTTAESTAGAVEAITSSVQIVGIISMLFKR